MGKSKIPESLEDFINKQDWLSKDIRADLLKLPEDVQGKLCAEIERSNERVHEYYANNSGEPAWYLESQELTYRKDQELKYKDILDTFKSHPVSIELYRDNILRVEVPGKKGDFQKVQSDRYSDEQLAVIAQEKKHFAEKGWVIYSNQSLPYVLQPRTLELIKQREEEQLNKIHEIVGVRKFKSELIERAAANELQNELKSIQRNMHNLFNNEALTDQLKKTTSLEGSKLSNELTALVEVQKNNKLWTKDLDIRRMDSEAAKIQAEMKAVQKSLRKINKEAGKGPISKLVNYIDARVKLLRYPKNKEVKARFEAAKFMLSKEGREAMKHIKKDNKETSKLIGKKVSHIEGYYKSKKRNTGRGI